MPYKAKGQCVYKADTGKKVGCTKGPVKKYLAALHANVPDAKNESTCRVCGGDGWNIEPDEKGKPTQIQCKACSGQGNHKDPAPMIRKSGEPKNEPFNEAAKTMKKPSDKLTKVIKRIAKDVTDFQNYVDVDLPHDVTPETFYGIVMRDIKNPAIKRMWARMKPAQKKNLYWEVREYLYEKAKKEDPEYYGEDDGMYENIKLSEIAKKVMDEGEEEEFRPGGKMAGEYYQWQDDMERMKVCPKCHKKYIPDEYGPDECPRCARVEKGIK